VVDDGGDVTLLIHKAMSWRTAICGAWPAESHEEQVIKDLLKRAMPMTRSTAQVVAEWRGSAKKTTTAVHRSTDDGVGKALVPAIKSE